MSNVNNDILDAVRAAESALTDQTQEQAGSFELPPVGDTVGRLVTYVELGPQPFTWKGVPSGVNMAVSIGFELLSPKKNIGEDGAGQFLSMNKMKMSLNSKAKFFKLFESMRYGREDKKHMAQLLGEAFIITISHSSCGKFANIDAVRSPYTLDAVTGDSVLVNVPPATRRYQLFLWDNPTVECWNSIYIDGTWEDDNKIQHSKNKLQEFILSSPGFKGSKAELVISTGDTLNDADFGTGALNDDIPF